MTVKKITNISQIPLEFMIDEDFRLFAGQLTYERAPQEGKDEFDALQAEYSKVINSPEVSIVDIALMQMRCERLGAKYCLDPVEVYNEYVTRKAC